MAAQERGESVKVTLVTYRASCDIMITGDSKGQEIISDGCAIFNYPELAYFGIRVKREGGNYWLENEETIRQVCGKKWADNIKTLEFKIRFFPPDLARITDDNIINSYYTHTKDEIVKGTLFTDPSTAFHLAALILQADYGNYDPMVHDADFIKQTDCLPKRYSKSTSGTSDNIIMEYEKLYGKRPLQAQIEFLERSQEIHDCGVDYYQTKDKSGTVFNIGAGHDGIFIKHSQLDNLIVFKWVSIVTMRYDKKYLWLEIENKKPSTFEMSSSEVARIVFTAFIAQHNFKLGKRLTASRDSYGAKRSFKNKSSSGENESRTDSVPATPPSKRTLLTSNNGAPSPSKTDFRNYLLKMLTTPENIRLEYYGIDKVKSGGTHIAANLPENKPLNRFRDIVPYDDTRVVLKRGPAEERRCSDYINASHVTIPGVRHQYILAQGPKDNTIEDFWRMVWDNGVVVIAMVTQLKEGYRAKCCQYWPADTSSTVDTRDLEVTMKFVRDEVLYITRRLTVRHKHTDQTLEVMQLQLTSWPDHGVPKSPKDLLDYLREVQSLTAEMRKPNLSEADSPILIHCSAGVGRSGVLLIMDLLTRAIDQNQIVDIPDTLKEIRERRSHTVQTEEQYVFVYKALLSYLDTARLI